MTITELRNHEEYQKCLDKVKSYKEGFKFTLNWTQIPKAKANALRQIMTDFIEMGLLESMKFDLNLKGEITSETYRKI